jgi:hypothetical protein
MPNSLAPAAATQRRASAARSRRAQPAIGAGRQQRADRSAPVWSSLPPLTPLVGLLSGGWGRRTPGDDRDHDADQERLFDARHLQS